MMKFKTDENMPVEAAEDLHQAGYDTLTVIDQQLAGHADFQVAEVCRSEGRALLTLDLDFSDIRFYSPSKYPGIIVLRPTVQTISNVRRLVSQVIALISKDPLIGQLWIVDESQIRIRSDLPRP